MSRAVLLEIEMQNLFCQVSRNVDLCLRQPSLSKKSEKASGLKNTRCTAILWRKHRMAGIHISSLLFFSFINLFNDFIKNFILYLSIINETILLFSFRCTAK